MGARARLFTHWSSQKDERWKQQRGEFSECITFSPPEATFFRIHTCTRIHELRAPALFSARARVYVCMYACMCVWVCMCVRVCAWPCVYHTVAMLVATLYATGRVVASLHTHLSQMARP